MKLVQFLMMFIVSHVVACADLPVDNEQEASEKLLNSTLSSARPEVGRFKVRMNGQSSTCTGTLIRPNVVLTAAHCVNYLSRVEQFGSVVFDAGEFTVRGALSFDQTVGAKDIALLELAQSVPSHLIQSASIYRGTPTDGDRAEIYGYGCNHRQTLGGEYIYQKQMVSFTVGQSSSNLCPGDSGGPVFVNGQVTYVNSAYYINSGSDIYAEVGLYHETLNRVSDQLSQLGTAELLNQLQNPSEEISETNSEDYTPTPESNDNEDYTEDYLESDDATPEAQEEDQSPNEEVDNEDDICAVEGYYNDGICDSFCLMIDPDCEW